MSLLPRVRLVLARRPWIYWLAVCLCGAVVWSGARAAERRLDAARAGWGTTRRVWVAQRETAAGQPLIARPRQFPAGLVPAAALADLPAHPLAARQVGTGEVVVAADVAAPATVPHDWMVFAVTAEHAPALHAGSAVTVFASGRALCDGLVAPTSPPSPRGGGVVDVAVPGRCGPALAAALAGDGVVLAAKPEPTGEPPGQPPDQPAVAGAAGRSRVPSA